jgi:peptidyl-prolyl cis-trans isomerase SurA
MVTQIGSLDKVKYYKKNTEEEFRSYFFDILKENKLSSEMQKKIVEEVEITPEEVRFFQINTKEDFFWCRNGGGANSNYAWFLMKQK